MNGRIYTIPEISKAVVPVARAYGVNQLALFGSYARGNATPKSDIDLHIIDGGALKGLFKLAGFQRELQENLDVPVDLLTSDALSEDFLTRIRAEEVVLYG
ncbi:hypothetical protein FACS1894217_01410 [Clostridia bacterium]|nr:hypothetical protein FACS1894217_01410 [Clostridia bacterium]